MPSKDGGHEEFRKDVSTSVNSIINVEQRRVNTVTYVQRAASCFVCCVAPRGRVTGRTGEEGHTCTCVAWSVSLN